MVYDFGGDLVPTTDGEDEAVKNEMSISYRNLMTINCLGTEAEICGKKLRTPSRHPCAGTSVDDANCMWP